MDETTLVLDTVLPDPSKIIAVANAYVKLADSEKKAADNAKQFQDRYVFPALPTANRAGAPPVVNRAQGPYSRYDRANAQYNEAIYRDSRNPGSVSGSEFGDLRYAKDYAAKRLAKIGGVNQPISPIKAASDLLSSSRFGGGGVMPLVSKAESLISSILGPEVAALAGPIGLTVGALVEAGKAIYQFTSEAAASGRELSRVRFATGGTTGEASTLQALSRASGSDLSGLAGNLHDRLENDPYARMYGARLGIDNVPGPYGTTNTAAQMLQAIKGLRSITNKQEQLRAARALGITEAMPLTMISNGSFGQLGQDAKLSASIKDEKFQKQSAEFGAAGSRVMAGWEALSVGLSKNFFPIIIPALNGIADTEYALAAFFKGDLKTAVSYGGKALANYGISSINTGVAAFVPSLPGTSKPFINGGASDYFGGGDSAANSNTLALNANTRATAALTVLMQKGAIGGGDRARAAVSSYMNDGRSGYFTRPGEASSLRFGPLS